MKIVLHARLYGRFIELQSNYTRKKLHRTNQGSNHDSFSNRDNVRAPIQFRRERQLQHLKRSFFLKNRSINFRIHSTSAIRLVKQNKLSFSSIAYQNPAKSLEYINCYSSISTGSIKNPSY